MGIQELFINSNLKNILIMQQILYGMHMYVTNIYSMIKSNEGFN